MATNDHDTISEDAFMECMRNFIAPDPSPRNPRIGTQSSLADRIEAGYRVDGHSTWGFVIYRTTYESEVDWAEFMHRLRWWTKDAMEFCNGRDVLDRMAWTVFDDREQFNGMPVATIRDHFHAWTETAPQTEQDNKADGSSAVMGQSQRYRYCVLVDAESLKSAVHDTPPPPGFDYDKQEWVKVIDRKWLPRSENPIFAGRKPEPNVYQPIEGVAEEHIGWVKCPLPSVMTEYYVLLRDLNGYMISYRRPPAVTGYPWR